MRALSISAASLLFLACAADPMVNQMPSGAPPDPTDDPTPSAACETEPVGQTLRLSGEASGLWSGRVELSGEVTIPTGASVEVCPGTTLSPIDAAAKVV